MRTPPPSERFGLRAFILASAIFSASACAPAAMDAGGSSAKGGSTGSGGLVPSGSGGTTTSGSGGTTTSGSGGTTTSGTGGTTSGSGGTTSGSGGTPAGSGGVSGSGGMPRPDAGGTGGATTVPDGGGGADMAPAAVTFTTVYNTVLMGPCAACHNAGAAANHKGVILANKAMAYMTMKAAAGVIVPNSPTTSNLVKLLQNMGAGTAKRMPPAGNLLTAPQIKIVSDWIMGGALDN